jgi:predicted  nucleic acid-binding Zn-ribbon protein
MPRVTCRCGEKLKVQPDGPERIDCPKCGAKIRLRHASPPQAMVGTGDGFLRFLCPCGRRLKVPAADRPVAGKCPDCGRVVPVPTPSQDKTIPPHLNQRSQSESEARTEELDADDLARLETWGAQYTADSNRRQGPVSTATDIQMIAAEADSGLAFIAASMPPVSEVKFEAGLRVCPRCKKPVHLGAAICRECGTQVPRQ